MPKCLFERATGLLESGTMWDDIPHDPATHIQLKLDAYPDRRTERWDGASGVRPATAQEIADYDAAELAAEVDGRKVIKAVVVWAAGKFGVSSATARDEILTIYKGL